MTVRASGESIKTPQRLVAVATDGPAVLVFPANGPRAREFARTVRAIGLRVVCASSEPDDVDGTGEDVLYLPYVTAPEFRAEVTRLMDAQDVSVVYAPHVAVWQWFQELQLDPAYKREFKLCNEFVPDENWRQYSRAFAWAKSCLGPLSVHGHELSQSPPLNLHEYAGLHHRYNAIPGESDETKVQLLTRIARMAPKGNIVEIGSAYGRSAFALAWLSRFHEIGSLVCVDPWSPAASEDQGEAAELVNTSGRAVNWEQLFKVFLTSMAGFDAVGYIRKPSAEAHPIYLAAVATGHLSTAEFGAMALEDGIAILHVDGNHRYENVAIDIGLWTPLVKRDGWILIDDYVWAFGDGPRRAADELQASREFRASFVVGDTLCLRA